MAHVGVFYKLQFRRDLHVNSINSEGWPEAFTNTQRGLSGLFGNAIAFHDFLLVNKLTVDQPPMVWQSEPQDIGPFTIFARLQITIPTEIAQLKPIGLYEIFNDRDISPMAAAVVESLPAQCSPSRIACIIPASDIFLGDGVDCKQQWALQFDAARWDKYP